MKAVSQAGRARIKSLQDSGHNSIVGSDTGTSHKGKHGKPKSGVTTRDSTYTLEDSRN